MCLAVMKREVELGEPLEPPDDAVPGNASELPLPPGEGDTSRLRLPGP